MLDVRLRPLPAWPHPPTKSRRGWSTFRQTWNDTLGILEDELAKLGASNLLIAAGFTDDDLRLDGWPRSDARPRHPGVEVSFDTKVHGRLVYATDVCMDWRHNVRSIALGLGALRAVDRYGISARGQQYAGWRALPAGSIGDGIPTTQTEARKVISDVLGNGTAITEASIRDALRKAHPDTGGDDQTFRRVDAARRLLAVS